MRRLHSLSMSFLSNPVGAGSFYCPAKTWSRFSI